MSLIAKANESKYAPVSEGIHLATCVSIVDLGEQYSEKYENFQRRALLSFDVHDETVKIDGADKPCRVHKEYTISLGERSILRRDLESWRGKKFTEAELQGFDLKNILGKPCQLQILHSEKGYANISSIVSLPKGMTPPKPESELVVFDFDAPDFEIALSKLPEWIQKKIKDGETYKAFYTDGYEEKLPWDKEADESY